MANRYVFKKYNYSKETVYPMWSETVYIYNDYKSYGQPYTYDYTHYTGHYISGDSILGSGATSVSYVTSWQETALPSGAGIIYDGTFYASKGSGVIRYWSNVSQGRSTLDAYDVYPLSIETVVGSLVGYVSGTSNYSYPIDGVSGSYYYIFEGSDCIDPTSVSYSTTEPSGGKSITISVTARSNTYGGTISYQYQYSTNGGSSWTTITTTTSKSRSVTIPKGATQFMARVRASDNYGFTSSTYVSGANLTVKNDSNFVGVDGAVKGITAVLCVDGVVKTNVKMYHGVNGTVKQS